MAAAVPPLRSDVPGRLDRVIDASLSRLGAADLAAPFCFSILAAIPRGPALPREAPSAYISGVGQPTMAIKGVRNSRYGPGGRARRLHQSPLRSTFAMRRAAALWGRIRIDVRVKVRSSPGMVPPLSGQSRDANDNVALAAQAA